MTKTKLIGLSAIKRQRKRKRKTVIKNGYDTVLTTAQKNLTARAISES